MDFELSDRARKLGERLREFLKQQVHPAEAVYEHQLREAGDPHAHPPVMEELKRQARDRGLWNRFHPDPQCGHGLSNVEYAPLAEITVGNKHARTEIAAIKIAAPNVALKIIDCAIQVRGGAGICDDTPLAWMYAHVRSLRQPTGPTRSIRW